MKEIFYYSKKIGRYYLYGFLLQLCCLPILFAADLTAQTKSLKEVFVNIEVENASLSEVFSILNEKTEFSFVYDTKYVDTQRTVSLKSDNESLEDILLKLSASHQLSFQQVNKRISVKQLPADQSNIIEVDVSITGKVYDEEGEPLPGATVLVEGSEIGTATGLNGEFTIDAPENGAIIVSYIGFITKKVKVLPNKTSYEIILEIDDNALEEVVVVGYGEVKKTHLTGAVETIDPTEFEDLPTGDISTALAGRVLGVGVGGGGNRPGSQASIRIRGADTFAKNGNGIVPLYVIDGVIQIAADGSNDQTRFNTLDPAEIESISFLKDASAAIYGSRGASGAVIVTTKRGKDGKPRFSYSGSMGINDEAYRTKMLSAHEFGQYYNILNGPYGYNVDPTNNPDRFFSQDELDHFRTRDYDWLEDAWSSATTMRHNLNVSGGNDKSSYFASVSYFTQEGNLSTLDYDRWNFRAGADIDVMNNLKAGVQLAGYYTDQEKTFNKIGGENDENDYKNLLLTPRYVPAYIDDLPVRIPGTASLSQYHYYEIQKLNNLATTRDMNMSVNVYAEYEVPFLEGLKARIAYGRNMGSNRGTQVGTRYRLYEFDRLGQNQHIYDGAEVLSSSEYKNGDRLYYSNSNFLSTQTNFTLNYGRSFGKHTISALFSIEKAEAESSQEDVWKEEPTDFTNGQFSTAFGQIDGRTTGKESGSLGYVGRANYSYGEKYLAEFLFRSDASTKFAPENYWGKFYSVSAGWIISNENFFNSSWIDFLKIRHSLGVLGRDEMGAWQWRQRYTFQNGKGAVFGDNSEASTGMKMEASPNRAATWSQDFQNNLGIDANFLDGRLSTVVELYYNKETDKLIQVTGNVPVTVGGTVAEENHMEFHRYGFELGIGWRDQLGAFDYGIDLRYGRGNNKVVTGNFNDVDILYPWNPRPGEPSDPGVWGLDYLGMFKTQYDIDRYVEQYDITSVFGTPVDQLQPGMLYYRDIRGPLQADGTFAEPDGIIDDNDQIQLEKPNSAQGISSTIKLGYKGIRLNAVLSTSWGGWSEYDARKPMHQNISRTYQSMPAYWADIYDPELNPNGNFPNPRWEDISLKPRSEFWRVDSFRFFIRNINVSYTIPQHVSEKLKMSNARVYMTVLNPLNFYNPFGYKNPLGGSWDSYPQLRTFSLGLNLSF